MNNAQKSTVTSAWSEGLSSDELLEILEARVEQVATENRAHREAGRAARETEAAESMYNAANVKLAKYGLDLRQVHSRVIGHFSMQIRSLIMGQLIGPAEGDLARQILEAQEAIERAVEQQKQKQYTVSAVKRADSLGAVNVSWSGTSPKYQHVRLCEYRGVATRTLDGFESDAQAVKLLGNPVNAKDLLGGEVRREPALPDTLESLAELSAAVDAPNLEDYVIVLIGDPKLKAIDGVAVVQLIDLPRATTRDVMNSFHRRSEQCAHYVTTTIPCERVATALANQIATTRKLPREFKTTKSMSSVVGEL